MRMLVVLGLSALVLGLAPQVASAEEVQREGRVRGTVVTVGEINVVVQKAEGGQITLEPRWLGGGRGRDKEQIAFFRALKQGDQIEATWRLDEGTHFCVQSIAKLGADGARIAALGGAREGDVREGGRGTMGAAGFAMESGPAGRRPASHNETLVRGTVVAVGEAGRVIIQKAEGGQMTLEPRFVRVQGRPQGHPEIIEFAKGLKQGDAIEAMVRPGEGGHFMNWGIARPGGEMVGRLPAQPGAVWTGAGAQLAGADGVRRADGERRADGPAAEIQALRTEINGLRQEIAALKELINKLIEKK